MKTTICYAMNAAQRNQAREIAREMLDAGEHPQGLVHVLYYPASYDLAEDGIQGLSTALPPGTDLARGGYTSTYYTLEELAK